MDLSAVRSMIRAVATTIVPETSSLDEHAWTEIEAVVSRAISSRSSRSERRFLTFVKLLQLLPVVRYGRPFTSLSAPQRHHSLELVARSRVRFVRRGFSDLRSLVFLSYYTRDDVVESIGHHLTPGGWDARGGTVATVPLAPTLWIEP